MAEETKSLPPAEENPEAAGKAGGSKKGLIIIVAIVALLGGAAAFLLLTPMGKKLIGIETAEAKHGEAAPAKAEAASKEAEEKEAVFIDLPDLLVNLRTQNVRGGLLKMSLTLEVGGEKDEEPVKAMKPKIIDQFQIFLRELDIDDLKGAAGMQRIRQELLTRVNTITAPIVVRNVLFKEFLIQ